ncbi:GHKL domain-containing protein [Lachnotalea glycerini]|uniref:GHKL domain-containing protein n=1 Tax=Lachnotalea glycerini TaxID=1763509 RepID=A0A318ER21_9FIRM|nr:ATP-binding protein [Lachnotalea glycerini]PXV93406.1 GHKL domain-containing protein [Lachnotalea glycerini]
MERVLFLIMDLGENIIRGYLIVFLLADILTMSSKYKTKRAASLLLISQFVLVRMLITNIPVMKRLLYGETMIPKSNRTSILVILVSMCITILFSFILYTNKKIEILYLTFTYFTLSELTKFTLHSVFIFLLTAINKWISHMFAIENRAVFKDKNIVFSVAQLVWNLIFLVVFLSLFYIILKQLKKLLVMEEREIKTSEIMLLAVPSLIGFCFSILLRSIMYSIKGKEVYFLMDHNPETYFLIPAISSLCIVAILGGVKVLNELIKSSEKEIQIQTYKNQIKNMGEHMMDVEHLYDGIRGMKHDMKNYVADMESLIQGIEVDTPRYKQEMRKYLDGLCDTVEQLDLKYQTGNPVTDVVINRKMRELDKRGISFTCDFFYPKGLQFSAFDISIILNNALENALEAVKQQKRNAYIKLFSYSKKNMFFIEVQNSFDSILQMDASGELLSTKKDTTMLHGMGLKNIRSCAKKYFGKAEYNVNDKEFVLTIMLQGNAQDNSLHNSSNSLH